MIIVDVETSGVDPVKSSILSIGAVDFDTPSRRFYDECRIWDGAHINEESLSVNGFSVLDCFDKRKQTDKELLEKFLMWTREVGEWTIGGQNPSFDRDFLINTSNRYHINWPLAYRTIDLHSVAFFHMIKHNLAPPVKNNRSDLNLDRILEYVGIFVARKRHNALEDALLEAEAMNRLFYDRNLLEEYAHFPIPWTQTN